MQVARALRAAAHSTLHGVVFAILCLGSAKPVGWVERSDTHQSKLAKMMGFAKGSTHPTSYALLRLTRKRNLATRRRQNNPTGKSPKTCPDLRAKIFRFRRRANH